MSTDHRKLFPVYVWEVPVRVWHWLMVPAMLVPVSYTHLDVYKRQGLSP